MQAHPDRPSPGVLIALPTGLPVSGITTWALRLSGSLARRGHPVTLLAHSPDPGDATAEIDQPIPAGVRLARLPASLPSLDTCAGDHGAFFAFYERELDYLHRLTDRPVALLPSLSSECYALCASLAARSPHAARLIAWTHNCIEHDLRLCAHFEPALSSIVAVSQAIEAELAARLPASRSDDIHHVPYAVDAPDRWPDRPPPRARPLRLVYTGRIEHWQKRVGALIAMSLELTDRGVDHALTLIGDGPAAAEIDARLHTTRKRVRRLGVDRASGRALGPERVAALLREADVFVLASRFEGLSVSMLEAMAAGCAPVVTRVESGAAEAVTDGESGVLVESPATPDDSESAVGRALAGGVQRALSIGVHDLGRAAWSRARERYSTQRHADAASRLISAASDAPPRAAGAPAAAPSAQAAFSVPADAEPRARFALDRLAGRRVALWGAGRHTLAIERAVRQSRARVTALIDDDAARWGREVIGLPVMSAAEAHARGATDVLISSWMHEEDLWARRATLERLGLRVHRIYEPRTGRAPRRAAG